MIEPLTHTLKITLGARLLAFEVVSALEQHNTVEKLMLACEVAKILKREVVQDPDPKVYENTLSQIEEVVLTEKQRDLLKSSVVHCAKGIRPSLHALSLLQSLGFCP